MSDITIARIIAIVLVLSIIAGLWLLHKFNQAVQHRRAVARERRMKLAAQDLSSDIRREEKILPLLDALLDEPDSLWVRWSIRTLEEHGWMPSYITSDDLNERAGKVKGRINHERALRATPIMRVSQLDEMLACSHPRYSAAPCSTH